MHVVGVIAEYNPFHNGHLYQLNIIRKMLNPDGIVVVLSGNFVQRGEPAIFNKWARTKMALNSGADLIIELPVCFSTATAEIFAESAVKLLRDSRVVDNLSFGIEEYHEKELTFLGKLLSDEPPLLKAHIKRHVESGLSFPSAREKAVEDYLADSSVKNLDLSALNTKFITDLLNKPNSILGIEYVKAINKLDAKLSISPVKRKGSNYHNKNLKDHFSSATGIRHALSKNGLNLDGNIIKNLPDSSFQIIKEEIKNKRNPVFLEDFETVLLYTLRRLHQKNIRLYFDVEEGLENRIKRAAQTSGNLNQLISQIKSKRYPTTRIQRILVHILLNIPREMVAGRNPRYIRILGFNKRGSAILKEMHRKSDLPLVTRASEYKSLNPEAKEMFQRDLLSSDIYSLAYNDPTLRCNTSDFLRKIIYFNLSK